MLHILCPRTNFQENLYESVDLTEALDKNVTLQMGLNKEDTGRRGEEGEEQLWMVHHNGCLFLDTHEISSQYGRLEYIFFYKDHV